jgi:WD repeat-containing protein 55
VHPNKLLGLIGEHEDFPVETLKLSHDKKIIGSVSHTNKVHFWDVGYLFEDDDDEEDDGEEEKATIADEGTGMDHDEEMEDVDSSDSDNDDDSDMDVASGFQGRRAMPTEREKFFSDL